MADGLSDWIDVLSSKKYIVYGYPKNTTRIRKTLESLGSIGDIEKQVDSDGNISYRLTSAGWDKLSLTVPFFRFLNKPWDKLWRIVIYDIPEEQRKERRRLRIKLKTLGFGQWQRSVWVSPHPVNEFIKDFIKSSDLSSFCRFYEARDLFGQEKEIAGSLWNLGKLNDSYEKLYKRLIEPEPDKKAIYEDYKRLVMRDPGLPHDLLPNPWFAFLVRKKLSLL
ncbi:MAG: PaaX domain protein [Candidatus Gottesmanbacteria bacterium GW2011_GWC2_39_8]|uniref:PaaX domain protein n=1 Tax=Candidatus Gottesmanbacteria bacterium GW2011_GWC2_39_8 TaxID=1618450 RepID=A0A0G0PVI6_9BACT|nr:MAG: PaaX domain protein [Candidatus Gottesmanbacteria bacterium GW2011_GWC2_39_8]